MTDLSDDLHRRRANMENVRNDLADAAKDESLDSARRLQLTQTIAMLTAAMLIVDYIEFFSDD